MATKTTDAPVEEAPVEEAPVAVDYLRLNQKTIDAHEASIGWTVQKGDEPFEVPAVAGTIVTAAELPNKESLLAAGVDLDQYFAGLNAAIVADDAERDAVQGVQKA